jgi:hypothetical protein
MSVSFWQVQRNLERSGTRGDAEDGPPSPFHLVTILVAILPASPSWLGFTSFAWEARHNGGAGNQSANNLTRGLGGLQE